MRTWLGIVDIQVINPNNQELMKNIYIQGTCAPDSVLGFKVFALHSLCAQFQADYLMIKFLDFNYHYYLYS